MKTPEAALQDFWRDPGPGNLPASYLDGAARTAFLVDLLAPEHPCGPILEIGCNVGRNLAGLHRAGYRALAGIEINPTAVQLLFIKQAVAAELAITCAPVERAIGTIADRAYDVVFTMAVLEHLPPSSAYVFAEMARIADRTLVTIEDERGESSKHFPRDYQPIFEALGLVQQRAVSCAAVEGLGPDFMARVFRRAA